MFIAKGHVEISAAPEERNVATDPATTFRSAGALVLNYIQIYKHSAPPELQRVACGRF